MKLFLLRFSLVLLLSLGANAAPLDFKPDDSMVSILRRQVGQVIELRLTSGEKLGGKVATVGENLVHLTQLTGQDFFEAAVDIESISAVVVRARSN